MEKELTQERLKEVLDYDPKKGVFVWKMNRGGALKGSIAGVVLTEGYIQITIDYVKYSGHQLAWLYMYGALLKRLDHEDGVRSNNIISNLRPATPSQNGANKHISTGSHGYKGIHKNKTNHKWVAQIRWNGKTTYVGQALTAIDAAKIYDDAARKHYGIFACVNFPKDGEQGVTSCNPRKSA